MCVIMVAEDKRPSPEQVRAGFKANDRGAGFAWREPIMEGKGKEKKPALDGEGNPRVKVRWKKAITDIEEAVELSQKLPMPYILHCRIPSIGGPNVDLTHPFPICKDVRLDHEGEIEGDVLFHNGTWSKYDSEMFKAGLLRGVKLPRAPFSDSRMMAWITHLLGKGFLDAIDEKVIVFGPKEIEIWGKGKGWECVNGVWCSNDHFRRYLSTPRQEPVPLGPQRPPRDTSAHSSSTDGLGGDRRPVGFRGGPASVGNTGSGEEGPNLEVEVQGEAGRVREGSKKIIAAVSNVGDVNRHPLTDDERFRQEYIKLHGKQPPWLTSEWLRQLNPKKYRSSSVVGNVDLIRRRAEAAQGISRVMM